MPEVADYPHVYFAGEARVGLPKEARVMLEYQAHGSFPTPEQLRAACDPVAIGPGSFVGNGVTIYEGTELGRETVLEDLTRIGFDCRLGDQVRVMYGAYICDRVHVGPRSRVAGFLCDAARVGADCTIMGQVVHKYTVPDLDWGAVDEATATIEDDVIVGYGAIIVGGITIHSGSYIAAGAIVTRTVPPNTVVTGTNCQTLASDWTGRDLRNLFARRDGSVGDD